MKKPAALLATLGVAGALALSAPLTASAYTPSAPEGTTAVAPGGTATLGFGGFAPGETITFSLTGWNASGASLATIVRTAVETASITKPAAADGSTTVDVTLPADAAGAYTVTATGGTSGASASAALDTGIPVPAEAGGGSGDGSGSDSLSPTGGDLTSVGLWVGGGALLLGGAAVVTATAIRRQRSDS
ncbi:hypothetical protein GCM10023351_23120 [Microbacterium gilvum]|uniref:Sortase n=2 Tax=Microbacterium gilvum TaxID=1336204 RepID=A0ABP9ABZ1_9MICO